MPTYWESDSDSLQKERVLSTRLVSLTVLPCVYAALVWHCTKLTFGHVVESECSWWWSDCDCKHFVLRWAAVLLFVIFHESKRIHFCICISGVWALLGLSRWVPFGQVFSCLENAFTILVLLFSAHANMAAWPLGGDRREWRMGLWRERERGVYAHSSHGGEEERWRGEDGGIDGEREREEWLMRGRTKRKREKREGWRGVMCVCVWKLVKRRWLIDCCLLVSSQTHRDTPDTYFISCLSFVLPFSLSRLSFFPPFFLTSSMLIRLALHSRQLTWQATSPC